MTMTRRALICRYGHMPSSEYLLVFPLGVFPLVCYFQKCFIPILPDVLRCFLILAILEPVFVIKTVDDFAKLIFGTIRTCLKPAIDATNLHGAFGFGQIALALIISKLASLACLLHKRLTRLAICPATTDFRNRHGILLCEKFRKKKNVSLHLNVFCRHRKNPNGLL